MTRRAENQQTVEAARELLAEVLDFRSVHNAIGTKRLLAARAALRDLVAQAEQAETLKDEIAHLREVAALRRGEFAKIVLRRTSTALARLDGAR